jgi:hypothetical protein
MKKLFATLACAAMVALPTAANASDRAGAEIGGNYGPSACYVTLDYFRVDVSVQSYYPFVNIYREGSIGGGVHCPLVHQ